MKLLRLIARNFKGIKEFIFEPNGADASVFGANGTGKTTLADAVSWLLHGKDTSNRADFDIKTLDADNNPIHMLSHEVEGVFRLNDGRIVTLTRCYEEQWTRRRGSAEQRFTGHQTGYHIDGVPKTKREFDDFVASIAEESVFRLLSDPTYFNEHLHWEKQRELVIQVAGDVSDEDVIASGKELAGLTEILTNRTLDEHRKVVAERRKKINDELKKIPVRIDEVDKGQPELPEADKATLQGQLAKLREQRSAKDAEKTRIKSGGEVAEQRKRLAEIETELTTAQNRIQKDNNETIQAKRTEVNGLRGRVDTTNSDIRILESEISDTTKEITRDEKRMQDLRDEWKRKNAEQFADTLAAVADACPACEQALPSEQVAEAQRKAQEALDKRRAEFNESKATRLAEITAGGKPIKAGVEKMQVKLVKLKADRDAKIAERDKLDAQIQALTDEAITLESNAPDPMDDAKYAALAKEKGIVSATIVKLQADNTESLATVDAEIVALDEQIASVEASVALYDQHERGEKRKTELADEERKLAAEFEKLEHELFLMDEFAKAKVRLLDERINSKFKITRFKMFREQVNGGIEPTCQTLLNGVPWPSINGAGRIQVGLDIINTLAEHYGFAPPVFVDDAVTVTEIPATVGQQIRLVVSAADKTLRVVTDDDQQLKEAS